MSAEPKTLTLDDLDREELLALFRIAAPALWRSDIWSVRWKRLTDKEQTAFEAYREAQKKADGSHDALVKLYGSAAPRKAVLTAEIENEAHQATVKRRLATWTKLSREANDALDQLDLNRSVPA